MSSASLSSANKGPEAVRVCTALTILGTIAVVLRIWARKHKRVSLAADDYTIIASLVLVYGLLAIIVVAVRNGLGQSVVVVATTIPYGVVSVLKSLMACEIVYGAALAVIKISVLLMYKRIFPTRTFRVGAAIIGTITLMWWIAVTLVAIFQCTPVAMAYDKTLSGRCIDNNKFYIGNAVPNIITDLMILALPAREVWNLQIPKAQKLAISGIFMMGGVIIIISIIRLVSLFELSAQGSNADITSILTLPWIWTTIEPCIGIISACLPTLRPLAVMCFGRTPRPSAVASDSNLATIGGTVGKGSTKSSNWSLGKVKGDDGTGSFERLHEIDGQDELTPPGYSTQRKNRISVRTERDEDIPLGSITVRKELNWEERTT